ncbi:multiheme c-type cytochrome [Armatimonas rosea]|uniref:Cytochrome c-552/4 domain-containing protein n=1 Tax=Armatimonas rosea TaxID=685828 RepID=A0A7W9ST55_ARMRO|nr:multiheme c-type cytochrome [Armatimonas rosea]MBB6052387.1 hypothetical protein [Armatimonas rosea]
MTWRVLCGIAPILVLLLAACTPKAPEPPAPSAPVATPDPASLEPTLFMGNAACKPCHAAEFTSHAHTKHMQTLHEATQEDLGELAPTPGAVPGGGTFTLEQGRFHADSPIALKPGERVPLSVVLGSGKTGMTFMALFTETGAEIRQSYFPHEKKWFLTPGQERAQEGHNGRIYTKDATMQCLTCHCVTLPQSRLLPERRFFGVGCESCHGPGSEHVVAMQKGDKSKGVLLTALRGVGGKRLNEACGTCHRTPSDVAAMDAGAREMTQRFQPYGLSLSKCFQKSADKLSCVTCHNPHEDASTDTKQYEAVCVSCHAAPKKACPVNPKEKCVSCHMPTRRIFNTAKSEIPIAMADHFIRVFKK